MQHTQTLWVYLLEESNPSLQSKTIEVVKLSCEYLTSGGLQCRCTTLPQHWFDCPLLALIQKQYADLPQQANLNPGQPHPWLLLLFESDYTCAEIKMTIDAAIAEARAVCATAIGIEPFGLLSQLSSALADLLRSQPCSPLRSSVLSINTSSEAFACLPKKLLAAKPSSILPARKLKNRGFWSYLNMYLSSADQWEMSGAIYPIGYAKIFSLLPAGERNGRPVTLKTAFKTACRLCGTIEELLSLLFDCPFLMCGRLLMLALANPPFKFRRQRVLPVTSRFLRNLLSMPCVRANTEENQPSIVPQIRRTLCVSQAGRNELRQTLSEIIRHQRTDWPMSATFCELTPEQIAAASEFRLPDFPIQADQRPVQAVLLLLSREILVNFIDTEAPLTSEAKLLLSVWRTVQEVQQKQQQQQQLETSSQLLFVIASEDANKSQLLSLVKRNDMPDLSPDLLRLIPFSEPKEWTGWRWLLTTLFLPQ